LSFDSDLLDENMGKLVFLWAKTVFCTNHISL
jgi:hypothetical protein